MINSPAPAKNKNSNLKINVYVISWSKMHTKALLIANSISSLCNKVTIVYSDPDDKCDAYKNYSGTLIKRSDKGFFSDKFSACLEDFDGDVLLIIHADCRCDNWQELISRCIYAFKKVPRLGLWSPLIDYTAFDLSKTEVNQIRNTSMSIVVQTDTIVTAFSNRITTRLRLLDYSKNVYGWGIGWAANAFALSSGLLSIVDREIKVNHPKESGYNALEASTQRNNFLKQCSPHEVVQISMMRVFMTRNGRNLL